MVKLGCGGNSTRFYEEGGTSSLEMPKKLHELNLNAYEYSCKKGIKLSDDASAILKENILKYDIFLSIHAPYSINLSADDEAARIKSLEDGIKCLDLAKKTGAKRVVFHAKGSNNITRLTAFSLANNMLSSLLKYRYENNIDVQLCPEISGKQCEFGSLDEIIKLCEADPALTPAINFGHLNARTGGSLKSEEDYLAVIKKIRKKLGNERAINFHAHFSHISYTNSGEKEHLTFADKEYGPFFEPLANVIIKEKLSPVIICESFDTQDVDAVTMKEIINSKEIPNGISSITLP